jgi:hypothetical protein
MRDQCVDVVGVPFLKPLLGERLRLIVGHALTLS